ncbi:MAG: biopolymer transporter ExbD [Prosthecobacter sp.]|jgi:biopolymer transport protein ExbD|uniref:ExbD/TolR family protein n=1 Tax=Prosthecobacter sp. TaxID=1965333 RepID=UPI001A04B0C7|nr:biopolymer transporter ExbD [Prosthecobacter sp.]MBE2284332.1 biopolymer transporter ExbD [Prosthecobacter sp.]
MNLRPRRRPVPQIPIVSLIDIMVILLIFFVATTTFKKDKTQVKITLPESKSLGGSAPAPESRVAISIDKEQKIFLDGKPVDLDKLAIAITSLKDAKPGMKLELQADTTAALGVLVKVWDALRDAGYSINDVPARIQKAGGS